MRNLMEDARYILLCGGWQKTEDTPERIKAQHSKYPGFEIVIERVDDQVKVYSLEQGKLAFMDEWATDLHSLRAAYRNHRDAIATQTEYNALEASNGMEDPEETAG